MFSDFLQEKAVESLKMLQAFQYLQSREAQPVHKAQFLASKKW